MRASLCVLQLTVPTAPYNPSLAFWKCTQCCIKLLLLAAGIVTSMAFGNT